MRCRFRKVDDEAFLEAFDPISDLSPKVRDMASNPRLLMALADLFGGPASLLKDKFLFKPPGASGYTLHQDYVAWDDFPPSSVIALIAMDASGQTQGGLEVWPGRHREGQFGPPDEAYYTLSDTLLSDSPSTFVQLDAGDVLFFHCMLPHRSGQNTSAFQRRHLYLTYNPIADGGDLREAHYKHFHRWIRNKYPMGLSFL